MITRTQRADHQVANLRRVFEHDHVFALAARVAELGDRGGGVGKQARLVGGIHPRAGDDAGAVARTDLCLVGVDNGVERGGIDEALFDQQRFERFDAQGDIGGDGLVVVVVIVGSTIVAHGSDLLTVM